MDLFPIALGAGAGSAPFLPIQTQIAFSGLLPTRTNFVTSFCRAAKVMRRKKKKKGREREKEKLPRAHTPIMAPCAPAAHHTCGTLNHPLKYYDMEKITLCFSLSTKEQSNYRAKHSRGRPNKEKSKKIWWKFLGGLTMFNHAPGLN